MLINTYVNAKEKEIKKEMKEANEMKKYNDLGFDEEEFRNIMAKLKEVKKSQGKLFDVPPAEGEDDDDFGDEGDSEYDVGEELIFTAGDLELYDSPLEKIDAPIYFKNVMEQLQGSNPELYETLVAALSPEQNEQLTHNFAKNEELLKIEKDDTSRE